MTHEAVRGGEAHRFPIPSATADIQLLYVFVRNVVGSMDYTPVVFQEALADAQMPYSVSLAQSVLFESGITHFGGRTDADPNEGYRAVFSANESVKRFMSAVPTTWDETRLLGGDPQSHAILARRSGSSWYLAAISGEDDTVSTVADLSFLGDGSHDFELIQGGATADSFATSSGIATSGDSLPVELGPNSGLVAVIRSRE